MLVHNILSLPTVNIQVVCLFVDIYTESILYTVCQSYLFLYIEIRNREVRVIGAYRPTTYESFFFNPLYYKHHCVPCKYVLFSADSGEALFNINNLFCRQFAFNFMY